MCRAIDARIRAAKIHTAQRVSNNSTAESHCRTIPAPKIKSNIKPNFITNALPKHAVRTQALLKRYALAARDPLELPHKPEPQSVGNY